MTLEDRVNRLERQNRRLKRSFLAVLVLTVCGFSAGAMLAQPGRIEARHFVLTDGQHQVGEWYVTDNGGATFQMKDFNGKVRFQVQSKYD